MRYVIAFVTVALFLIWDGLYNEGHYLDAGVKTVKTLVRSVTG